MLAGFNVLGVIHTIYLHPVPDHDELATTFYCM